MSNKGIAALIIGVLFAGAVGLVGFVSLVKVAIDRRATREREAREQADEERARAIAAEREERRADAVAAFADPKRPTPEEAAEFDPVFAALGAALKRGDANAVTRAFDPDRMMRELERIGTFDRLPPRMVGSFKDGIRQGMKESLGTNLAGNELVRWARTDVRQVRWSADRQEVAIFAIHRNDDADDVPLRLRWWLIHRANGWKIFDYEDLHLGISATRLISALSTPDVIERVGRDPLAFKLAVAALRDGMVLLARGDIDGGDRALAPARGPVTGATASSR